MKRFAACVVVLLTVGFAYGAGFQVNEQSANSAGMANSNVAHVNDASAIFYNPGGLGFLTGTQVHMGVTIFYPTSTWTSLDGSLSVDQKTKINWLPSVFLSYQLSDKVTVGIGNFTQYGLETDWPHGWPGTELSDRTKIRTYNVAPTIAFKLTDDFSVGFQVNYVAADVLLQKGISFVDTLAVLDMSGDGDGWGGSAGFQWRINDRMRLGGFWRSAVQVDFEGEADFDGVPTPFLPILYDGPISAGVKLPQTWGLGFSYQFNDKLLMEIGFMDTQWSTYDELAVYRTDTGNLLSAVPKMWKNVTMYKIGMEYVVNDKLTVRAGYIYDEAGAPDEYVDPSLPDNDRNDFSAGFDWKFKDFTFSAYAMWVHFNSRTTTVHFENFNGNYETDALLFGFGVDYRF